LSITASIDQDNESCRQDKDDKGDEVLIPEHAPLCEQRRQNEAAAVGLPRAKLAEIKDNKKPRFEPLLWKNSSFDFPSLDSSTRRSSEISSSSAASKQAPSSTATSLSQFGKKRKASDEPTTDYFGLKTPAQYRYRRRRRRRCPHHRSTAVAPLRLQATIHISGGNGRRRTLTD